MITYTWNEIFERAQNAGHLSQELKAKDNARGVLRELIKEKTGVDINECEVPEDAIDQFLELSGEEYRFDIDGNLVVTAE